MFFCLFIAHLELFKVTEGRTKELPIRSRILRSTAGLESRFTIGTHRSTLRCPLRPFQIGFCLEFGDLLHATRYLRQRSAADTVYVEKSLHLGPTHPKLHPRRSDGWP